MTDPITRPVVYNDGEHAVVLSPACLPIVQPALSNAELDLLRIITERGRSRSLLALTLELGCSYKDAWLVLRQLERRELVSVTHNGRGIPLIIWPMARLVEA